MTYAQIKAAIDAMSDEEIFAFAVFAAGCAGQRASLANMTAVNNLCYDFIFRMHQLVGTPTPPPTARA